MRLNQETFILGGLLFSTGKRWEITGEICAVNGLQARLRICFLGLRNCGFKSYFSCHWLVRVSSWNRSEEAGILIDILVDESQLWWMQLQISTKFCVILSQFSQLLNYLKNDDRPGVCSRSAEMDIAINIFFLLPIPSGSLIPQSEKNYILL